MTDRNRDLEPGGAVPEERGLWDPQDPKASEDVRALEAELGPLAWSGRLPQLPERVDDAQGAATGVSGGIAPTTSPVLRRVMWTAAVAAAALALLHLRPSSPEGGYELFVLKGEVRIDGRQVLDADLLRAGATLDSGPAGGVRVAVGDLGSVELGPDSRLRALDPTATDALHLFQLERGSLHAWITAGPRDFQVGTPAGLAVDLGCEYTATVESGGRTHLAVTEGAVSFEAHGRRVFVPRGAIVRADPETGPRTPYWANAAEPFVQALELVDAQGSSAAEALATVVGATGEDLSLTYWHLLQHRHIEVRRAAASRLAEIVPPPPGVSPAACVAGVEVALQQWRLACPWS